MNTTERRDLLTTFPNTENKLDYVVTLIDEIGTTPESKPAIVHLRYVPDKAVVDEVSFRRYLNALAKTDWQTFEELAALILHDFNNEIVARWTQVTVSNPAASKWSKFGHTVTIEDCQPHWDNPDILSRL